MKAVYMGTPEIAAVILNSLVETDLELAAVVTQPDKPKGRGKEIAFSEVKKSAIKHGIRVLQPQRVRNEEFLNEIAMIAPDIIIVAAFGQILPKKLLKMPKLGCINVHASLLPRYRGVSPIQHAVINGDEVTGVTIIYMDEGIDTGDMILKKELTLDKKETGGSLHDKLALLGAKALIEALNQIKDGTAVRTLQDNSRANYVHMFKKSDGLLDFESPADVLERLIRGLNPWPSAFTYLDGKLLKIWDTEALMDLDINEQYITVRTGTVIECSKDNIYIKTGNGVLKINELQPEGKKRMSCSEFLRGYQVKEGDNFGR